jgi:hypothetical protein
MHLQILFDDFYEKRIEDIANIRAELFQILERFYGDFCRKYGQLGGNRPHTEFGRLYVKLTVTDDVLIVSFKEYQP